VANDTSTCEKGGAADIGNNYAFLEMEGCKANEA
jgi:hypothetical protein